MLTNLFFQWLDLHPCKLELITIVPWQMKSTLIKLFIEMLKYFLNIYFFLKKDFVKESRESM